VAKPDGMGRAGVDDAEDADTPALPGSPVPFANGQSRPNFAKSFSPIANSIACRHAVMSSTSLRIKAERLEPTSENVNPPHMMGFTESMY
jgi:hypothetical protein